MGMGGSGPEGLDWSRGTVVEGVIEKEALGRDCGMGDGNGDRPVSEISVLDESAPGEEDWARQPKKLLILFAGVFGGCCWCLESMAACMPRTESMCSGGGRLEGRCKAMVAALLWMIGGDFRTGTKGSLTRRLWTGVPFVNCEG